MDRSARISRTAIGRREFAALAGGAILSVACGSACHAIGELMEGLDGRLTARPPDRGTTTASGEHALGLDSPRDAILRLPSRAPAGPMPFLLFLHGASGSGSRVLQRLGSSPDDHGLAIAAPDSRDLSWDAIRADFGPDVRFIDRVLAVAFARVAVDPARIAIGGFSDGATYALSLGLINGDLFRRVVAFSPGFFVDGPAHGRPALFISHGRSDEILPIDGASRRIVPILRARGCDVTFKEFDGGHEMPSPIVDEAMGWLAAPPK